MRDSRDIVEVVMVIERVSDAVLRDSPHTRCNEWRKQRHRQQCCKGHRSSRRGASHWGEKKARESEPTKWRAESARSNVSKVAATFMPSAPSKPVYVRLVQKHCRASVTRCQSDRRMAKTTPLEACTGLCRLRLEDIRLTVTAGSTADRR